MDCAVLADARGDPGVPANDSSIAWSSPERLSGRAAGQSRLTDQRGAFLNRSRSELTDDLARPVRAALPSKLPLMPTKRRVRARKSKGTKIASTIRYRDAVRTTNARGPGAI